MLSEPFFCSRFARLERERPARPLKGARRKGGGVAVSTGARWRSGVYPRVRRGGLDFVFFLDSGAIFYCERSVTTQERLYG